MIERLMHTLALSEEGAKGLVKAVFACAAADFALMVPVMLLYMLTEQLLMHTSAPSWTFYLAGIAISLFLIWATDLWKYDATYFSTYRESGRCRIRLAEKLRALPLSFFGKKDLADLTNTVLGDVATTEQMFSHYVPQYWGSLLCTIVIGIGILFTNWQMGIAALWVLPVSLVIVGGSKRATNYFGKRQNRALVAVADGIQEDLEAIRDLRSCNAEKAYLCDLDRKIDTLETRSIVNELGAAMFVVPSSMILKLGIATVAVVGSSLLVGDQIGVMTFFMFLLVVSRLYEPMALSLQNLAAMNSLQINIDRMNEITEFEEQTGSTQFAPKNYDIAFKHVGFAYENDTETVLRDVSFTAKQGEVTALVGPSGGGKSTVARLATRFWDADKGTVTVGGTDVSSIDPEELLKSFSIVFQDVTLFSNSILENIRIGRENATDEEVLAAAKAAMCDEFVSKLPDGYNTVIGENGSMLSGGERQRISIARALLKDSPVIVLDEATASLDAENETQIQKALSRLVKDKTVLIIAHRMRTVLNANKVVVLQDGVVAEQGAPRELLKEDSIFAHMVQLQSTDEAEEEKAC